MPCRSASKVPANGANGYATPELSLWALHTSSLAIDDDRCVSNEIECLAHEYYNVFTIPCAFFFSCYFAPSQTCEPNLDNAPSKLLGRLVAMPVQSFPNIFRMIAAR